MNLDNLKKEAKRKQRELRAQGRSVSLREVQLEIARKYGFAGWAELKKVEEYERLAEAMVSLYSTSDADALRRVNLHYRRAWSVEDFRSMVWSLVYKVRRTKAFDLSDARELITRMGGYHNWAALREAVAKGDPPPVPAYRIDTKENRIAPQRAVAPDEWDQMLGAMSELRIVRVDGRGWIDDAALDRIAAFDHVTELRLEGCKAITDDGLLALAKMPQLEYLDISATNITDRGLEVLRHLPNLRGFKMVWQRSATDAGLAHLRGCDKIERVELMGSGVGDGAIEALRGKPVHHFETGRLVTDRGLAMLLDFPMFRTWHRETRLLLDGPFSDEGLAGLAGLDGVSALDLFWHCSAITPEAFASLKTWANLESVGCDDELANDASMRHIATIPKLKKLRAQDSSVTDEGFLALAQSASLEEFWGRTAPGLTGRGFVAFAKMPRLRVLGIGCENVADASLARLPDFPALATLTPIGFSDDGFRHVGKCSRLEDLSCMYCRSSSDASTEHIAGLRLKHYYAGLTQITDRSLEILGRIDSLERVELYETKSVTDAGLRHLAALPRLREVSFTGMPLVSFAGTRVFPSRVAVNYDV